MPPRTASASSIGSVPKSGLSLWATKGVEPIKTTSPADQASVGVAACMIGLPSMKVAIISKSSRRNSWVKDRSSADGFDSAAEVLDVDAEVEHAADRDPEPVELEVRSGLLDHRHVDAVEERALDDREEPRRSQEIPGRRRIPREGGVRQIA